MNNPDLIELANRIGDLPTDFHDAGVLPKQVLLAICTYTKGMDISNSVETGSGKSTLLLSWISARHNVFTLENYGDAKAKSLTSVVDSSLFNASVVNFILGPTQQTLPRHHFDKPLQLVLIDGPHAFPFPQLEYYFLYPHLEENGLLILDDIHIPTISSLDQFLREDEMFEHLAAVGTTSFFRRTAAPTFNPYGDDWLLQNYNIKRIAKSHASFRSPASRIYHRIERHFGKGVAEFARGVYNRIAAWKK